jgi:hypothetical protein
MAGFLWTPNAGKRNFARLLIMIANVFEMIATTPNRTDDVITRIAKAIEHSVKDLVP